MERKRVAEAAKGVGKPKVGGKFELVDQNWKPWGSERMRGRFALVSSTPLRKTVRPIAGAERWEVQRRSHSAVGYWRKQEANLYLGAI